MFDGIEQPPRDDRAKLTQILSPMQLKLLEMSGFTVVDRRAGHRPNDKITPPSLDDVLSGRVVPTLMDICVASSRAGGTTPAALRNTGKARCLVRPRQVALMLSRDLTGHSLTKIGHFYSRDHSTVAKGLAIVDCRIAERAKDTCDLNEKTLSLLPDVIFNRLMGEHDACL